MLRWTTIFIRIKWLEQNKPQGNQLPRRFPESNWLPKRSPERVPPSPLVSRNPTDSSQEQLPSEKSGSTRSPLTSSSENFPSRDSSEKSPMSSSRSSDSRAQLCLLSKKLLKLTSSPSSKTPTCAPSTPRESPSWPETSNLPRESEEIGSDLVKPICIHFTIKVYNIKKGSSFSFASISGFQPACGDSGFWAVCPLLWSYWPISLEFEDYRHQNFV